MTTQTTSTPETATLQPHFKQVLDRVYVEREIYLLRANYADAQISGDFRWFTPTCYKKEPSHLTRIQIVSYVGQLSYLFGALLARAGLCPFSEAEFLEKIESDRATFMNLQLRFREFIKPSTEVEIKIACKLSVAGEPLIKRVRKLVVAPFLIDIANGACTGESEAVVLL